MRKNFRGRFLVGACVAVVLVASRAQAAPQSDEGPPRALEASGSQVCAPGQICEDGGSCEKSYWKPVGRIALTQLVMQVSTWAIWPDTYGPAHFSKTPEVFTDNFWHPPRLQGRRNFFKWDGDAYFVNIVGHGLFGSEMYLAARDWGHGIGVSFLYALAGSAFWEYFVEGLFERPSSVDLIWTPTSGLIFGEVRHRVLQWVRRDVVNPIWRQTLLFVFDPVGELERLALYGCERRFL